MEWRGINFVLIIRDVFCCILKIRGMLFVYVELILMSGIDTGRPLSILEFDYSHTMPIINSGYPESLSIDTSYAEINVTSIDIGHTQHRYWASNIDLV